MDCMPVILKSECYKYSDITYYIIYKNCFNINKTACYIKNL